MADYTTMPWSRSSFTTAKVTGVTTSQATAATPRTGDPALIQQLQEAHAAIRDMKRQLYIKDELAIRAATADLEQQNAEFIAQLRVKQKREDAVARVFKETYDIKATHEARIYQMNKKMAEMDKKNAETDKKIAETDKKIAETDKKIAELNRKIEEMKRKEMKLKVQEMDLKIQEAKTRHHRLLLEDEQRDFDEHEARFEDSAREEWEKLAKEEKALASFKTYLEAELGQCSCERKRSRLHDYYATLLSDE